MMHIKIIQIGKTREPFVKEGEQKYWDQLTPYCKLESVILNESKLQKADLVERIIHEEGDVILEHLEKNPGSFVVTLEVSGHPLSSQQLAMLVKEKRDHGPGAMTFIIGGPFGLDTRVSRKAQLQLSFSTFTFTHEMIRLLLLEQLFRTFTIIQGKTYHY